MKKRRLIPVLCAAAVAVSLYVVKETQGDSDLLDLTQLELAYTTIIYSQQINDQGQPEWVEYQRLQSPEENRIWKPLNEISPYIQHAFVAVEDENFYTHPGFSFKRTVLAAINEVFRKLTGSYLTGSQLGASTIEQQLIKNITGEDESSGIEGYARKVKEIFRAIALDNRFSKEEMIKYLHYFEMDIDIDLGSLSMGQKKKVFMSFALATNTSLLLMDEPTNGLDIPGKSQFRKFIASGMSDDKTIVISTHQVRDIDKVLDHVLIMDDSRVLLDESTSNICDKLFFVESDDRELAKSALFAIPTIQGNYLILPNEKQDESELNLELLFNATLATPEEIARLFHTQK